MWWHKDTRRSHANRILTLPDKMRLFLLPFFYYFLSHCWDYSRRAFLCCSVSHCCSRHSYCTSVHPRQIGRNEYDKNGNQLPCITCRAEGCFIIFTLPPKGEFCACKNKFVCLVAVYNNLKEAKFIFSDGDGEAKRRVVRQKAMTGGNILLPPLPAHLYLLKIAYRSGWNTDGILQTDNYWVYVRIQVKKN